MTNKYFFDSYAVIEVIKGNNSYVRFSNEVMVTTVINLSEIYYFLTNQVGEKVAKLIIDKFDFEFLEITPELAIQASSLRHHYKKKKLSYADCIGYVVAVKNNLLFLTGDNGFCDIPQVEFVK